MDRVSELVAMLAKKLAGVECDTVLAPAMGGLVLGQEVARQLGKRFIFAEKQDGNLVLRRNFKIGDGEKILIVEDVITRGGRVQECIDIVKANGGKPAAVAVLVDRSEGKAKFEVPCVSLLEFSFPTYAPDADSRRACVDSRVPPRLVEKRAKNPQPPANRARKRDWQSKAGCGFFCFGKTLRAAAAGQGAFRSARSRRGLRYAETSL